MKSESLSPLRQEFDGFTERCLLSKLPDEMQPSAVLIGFDPLLSQGTFRMTGNPHALAQALLHSLRDPANEALKMMFWEVVNELVK